MRYEGIGDPVEVTCENKVLKRFTEKINEE